MEKTSKDVCEEVKNFPADMTEDMSQAGLDKFESLVCGFETNFLSFGLILLCTLFKFSNKDYNFNQIYVVVI